MNSDPYFGLQSAAGHKIRNTLIQIIFQSLRLSSDILLVDVDGRSDVCHLARKID